jgi:hypothetical protein
VQQIADTSGDEDRGDRCQRNRYARKREEHRRHRAEHHELALRKIHDERRIVDESEAECDERVHGSDRQPRQRKLQDLSADHCGRTGY